MTGPKFTYNLEPMSDVVDKKHSKHCIMQTASRLFAKLGLDKCSTREIAKDSDSNISLISYYFGGKEGLYKEVMREYALGVKADVQGIVNEIDNEPITKERFIKNITFMIDHMIDSHNKNPEVSKIFAREKLAGFPHSREIHAEIFYPLITQFFKLFKGGQAQGFIKKDIHPALFFISLSEAIWGFYMLMECETPLVGDCKDLLENSDLLREQFLKIYLKGVLE